MVVLILCIGEWIDPAQLLTFSADALTALLLLARRVPDECPAEIAALITACLMPQPEARPTMDQVYRCLHDA